MKPTEKLIPRTRENTSHLMKDEGQTRKEISYIQCEKSAKETYGLWYWSGTYPFFEESFFRVKSLTLYISMAVPNV